MKINISNQKKALSAITVASAMSLVAVAPVSAGPAAVSVRPTPANFTSLYDYARVTNAPTGVFNKSINSPNAVVNPTPLQSAWGSVYTSKTERQPDGVPGGVPGLPCFSLTPTSGKLTLAPPAEPTGWLKVIELDAPVEADYTGKVLTIDFDAQVMMAATRNTQGSQDGMVFSCTVFQGASKTPCSNTISYPLLSKSMVFSSTSPNYPVGAQFGQENRVTQMTNYKGWVEFSGGAEVPKVEIKVGYLGNASNLAASPTGGQICYGHLTVGLANKQ